MSETQSVNPQAIHGQAIDRHLLGLKMQGIEDLTSLPEIFMDTSYAVAMHFNLFTSQVCGIYFLVWLKTRTVIELL